MDEAGRAVEPRVDRRTLIAAAVGAGFLGGCAGGASAARTPTAGTPVADAHVHLFNAADLPISGFVRHVYLPGRFPDGSLPDWARALAGFFLEVVHPLAEISIRAEYVRSLFPPKKVTPESFGQRAAEHVDELTSQPLRPGAGSLHGFAATPSADQELGLRRSYDALGEAAAAAAGVGSGARPLGDPFLKSAPARRESFERFRFAFTELARRAEGGSPATFAAFATSSTDEQSDFARLIGWAYLMCLSRTRHLEEYLRTYSRDGLRPRLLVNHLVDYDMWLGSRPRRIATQRRQVEFMARLARRHRPQVDVLTFAPFDPLKNAIERKRGGRTTLQYFQQAYVDGKIAGFKLYPPMGFRALGNATLANSKFAPGDGIQQTALRAWNSEASLGKALDEALGDFYTWSTDEKIDAPLMAHAAPGNLASKAFRERVDPVWWERAVAAHPRLRLSFGHLVDSAADFVAAVKSGDHAGVWALGAPTRLFANPNTRVYGDLGYMPKLVERPELAKDFFVALRKHYGEAGLQRILYGSDWIMLGQEPGSGDYLGRLRDGMKAAGYGALVDDVCWNNTRRYLKLA